MRVVLRLDRLWRLARETRRLLRGDLFVIFIIPRRASAAALNWRSFRRSFTRRRLVPRVLRTRRVVRTRVQCSRSPGTNAALQLRAYFLEGSYLGNGLLDFSGSLGWCVSAVYGRWLARQGAVAAAVYLSFVLSSAARRSALSTAVGARE